MISCNFLHCPAQIPHEWESSWTCSFLRLKNVIRTTNSEEKKFKIIASLFWIIWLESWKSAVYSVFFQFFALSGAYISKTGIFLDMQIFLKWQRVIRTTISKYKIKIFGSFSEKFGLKLEKVLFFAIFCNFLHCPAEISQEPESFRACTFLRW